MREAAKAVVMDVPKAVTVSALNVVVNAEGATAAVVAATVVSVAKAAASRAEIVRKVVNHVKAVAQKDAQRDVPKADVAANAVNAALKVHARNALPVKTAKSASLVNRVSHALKVHAASVRAANAVTVQSAVIASRAMQPSRTLHWPTRQPWRQR